MVNKSINLLRAGFDVYVTTFIYFSKVDAPVINFKSYTLKKIIDQIKLTEI
jgi:hypothetical protein